MSSMIKQGAELDNRKKKPATRTERVENGKIAPRDLKIVWGSDETQWKIELPDDENQSFAEALKVMWFEVKATYKGAKAGSKYKIGFKISLTGAAFGWDSSPVYLMAKVGEFGSYTWKRLYLSSKEHPEKVQFDFPSNFEIVIPISAEDTTLIFGLYEIWGGRWKGGMRIHHAYVTKV